MPLFVIKALPANVGTKNEDQSLQAGEHIKVLWGWGAWRGHGAHGALPPYLAPCISSIWLFLSYILS